jgi:hypothetical protein
MLELSLEKSHSKKGWGTRQAGSSRGQVTTCQNLAQCETVPSTRSAQAAFDSFHPISPTALPQPLELWPSVRANLREAGRNGPV